MDLNLVSNISIARGACTYSPRKSFLPESLYGESEKNSSAVNDLTTVESIIDLKKTDGQKLHQSCFVADTGEMVNFIESDSTVKVILSDCHGVKTRNGWILDLSTRISNSKMYHHGFLFFSRDLLYAVLVSYIHIKKRFFKKEIVEGLEIRVIALLTEPSDTSQSYNKTKILEQLYIKKEKQILYVDATLSSQGMLSIHFITKDIDYVEYFTITPYVKSSSSSSCTVQIIKSTQLNENVYRYKYQFNSFGDVLSFEAEGNVYMCYLSSNEESIVLKARNLFFVNKETTELAIYNISTDFNASIVMTVVKPFSKEVVGTELLKASDVGLSAMTLLNAVAIDANVLAFVDNGNYILAIDVFAKQIVYKLDVHYIVATRSYLTKNQICWSGRFVYLTYCNQSNRRTTKCFRLDSTLSLVSLAKAVIYKTFSLEQLKVMELPNILKSMLKVN